jgi:hypothetical protein
LARMAPEDVQIVVGLLVDLIETADQHVTRVVRLPRRGRSSTRRSTGSVGNWRPRTDSGARHPSTDDLAWYAEAG